MAHLCYFNTTITYLTIITDPCFVWFFGGQSSPIIHLCQEEYKYWALFERLQIEYHGLWEMTTRRDIISFEQDNFKFVKIYTQALVYIHIYIFVFKKCKIGLQDHPDWFHSWNMTSFVIYALATCRNENDSFESPIYCRHHQQHKI